MPLLTELENFISFISTKISRLRRYRRRAADSIPKMAGQRAFVRDIGFNNDCEQARAM
jgi:hypothetical protein